MERTAEAEEELLGQRRLTQGHPRDESAAAVAVAGAEGAEGAEGCSSPFALRLEDIPLPASTEGESSGDCLCCKRSGRAGWCVAVRCGCPLHLLVQGLVQCKVPGVQSL